MFSREKVLKNAKGGPHSYGDPEDQKMQNFEKYRLVPAYQREIIVRNYCSKIDNEYSACCRNNYWTKKFRCRQEFSSLKSCIDEYWNFPNLKKQAETEYLKERSLFRLTGLKKSERDKVRTR